MATRFKNSWDRAQRAGHHARAIADEWDAIMQGETTRTEFGKHENPGWWTVYASLTPEAQARADKNTLALELGELAYQLRAALDGLMWDAITYIKGTEPPSNAASRLEFPITRTDAEFKTRGFHKFPYPQKLVDWLESVQPYAAVKPKGDVDRGLNVTLEDIHNLARLDRHRRLRVIAAYPKRIALLPETEPPGGDIIAHEFFDYDLLSGQGELMRLKIECPGGMSPYNVRLKAHAAFEIFIEDIELYDGENVSVQFARFIQAVHHVIGRFEEDIP